MNYGLNFVCIFGHLTSSFSTALAPSHIRHRLPLASNMGYGTWDSWVRHHWYRSHPVPRPSPSFWRPRRRGGTRTPGRSHTAGDRRWKWKCISSWSPFSPSHLEKRLSQEHRFLFVSVLKKTDLAITFGFFCPSNSCSSGTRCWILVFQGSWLDCFAEKSLVWCRSFRKIYTVNNCLESRDINFNICLLMIICD